MRFRFLSLIAAGVCLAHGAWAAQQRPATAKPAARSGIRAPAKPAPPALNMEFVRIAPGEFNMGSENGREIEKPVHHVRITKPFELGRFEVTQAQWESVLGSNPSEFKGPDLPVDSVSWNDIQEFLDKANAADRRWKYRLPTEAEWEYAARAGATGDYAGDLDEMAWYHLNADSRTHPVGTKKPNAWGLFDMHGNVWEWVADWFQDVYYRASPETDPPGPPAGLNKALRGGSWGANASFSCLYTRIAFHPSYKNHYLGFRIVREPRAR
jgi:formylglycine-generating enzyme required for sulfatase activity